MRIIILVVIITAGCSSPESPHSLPYHISVSGEGSSKPLPPIDLSASLDEQPVIGKQVTLRVRATLKTDAGQMQISTAAKNVALGVIPRNVFPAARNKQCECEIPITCSTTEQAFVDVGVSADLPDGTRISRVVRVSFNGADEKPEPPPGGIEKTDSNGQRVIEYQQK